MRRCVHVVVSLYLRLCECASVRDCCICDGVVVMSVRVCMCVVVSEIVVALQSCYRMACTSMILAINCTLGTGKGREELQENMLAVANDDSWFA